MPDCSLDRLHGEETTGLLVMTAATQQCDAIDIVGSSYGERWIEVFVMVDRRSADHATKA